VTGRVTSSGDEYHERVIYADYGGLLTSEKNRCRTCSLLQSAVSEFRKPFLEKNLNFLESLQYPGELAETPRPSSNIPFRRDPDFVDLRTLLDQLHHRCFCTGSKGCYSRAYTHF
jgi:hypothetical protein